MHLNAHLAIGTFVAVALVALVPVPFSSLEVAAGILAACAIDGDFLFTRFARDRNHRMLPTHGVLVPATCTVAGVIALVLFPAFPSTGFTVMVCGANVLVHQLVDSVDWGLNFFMNGRLAGARILLGNRTPAEFQALADRHQPPQLLFYHAYYRSRVMRGGEIAAVVLMVVALVAWPAVAAPHWTWVPVLYVVFLVFHVGVYAKHASRLRDDTGAGGE